MTEATSILPDGRRIGYAMYGATGGRPVLYFHGTPSSRLEIKLLDAYHIPYEQQLAEAQIRLIAVDRPGMGLSDFHPGGTLLSFADDVYALLQALAISSCPVLCWSGGGPFALAMAWKYPAVIRAVFILTGFTTRFDGRALWKMSANKWFFLAAKHTGWLLELSMNIIRRKTRYRPLPRWLTGLSGADYRLLKKEEQLTRVAVNTMKEACRRGAKGPVHEARLYFNPFGFKLSAIQQPVHFWWGTADRVVPRIHAEAIGQQVKNSVLHYRKGEGHLSVYVHCFTEVVEAVLVATKESTDGPGNPG